MTQDEDSTTPPTVAADQIEDALVEHWTEILTRDYLARHGDTQSPAEPHEHTNGRSSDLREEIDRAERHR